MSGLPLEFFSAINEIFKRNWGGYGGGLHPLHLRRLQNRASLKRCPKSRFRTKSQRNSYSNWCWSIKLLILSSMKPSLRIKYLPPISGLKMHVSIAGGLYSFFVPQSPAGFTLSDTCASHPCRVFCVARSSYPCHVFCIARLSRIYVVCSMLHVLCHALVLHH